MSEAEVFDQYRAGWAQTYGTPCHLLLSPLDYAKAGIHLRDGLTEEQLTACLRGYFENREPFLTKRRHPLALFLREPTRYLPIQETPLTEWLCTHTPHCMHRAECTIVGMRTRA